MSYKFGQISGRVHARKVHIDRGGYDSHGHYWGGGGEPLYHVTDDYGAFDQHVRASSAKEALEKLEVPRIYGRSSKKLSRYSAAHEASWKRNFMYAQRHPEVLRTIEHYKRQYGETVPLHEAVRRHLKQTRAGRSR